ncbi:hypothetical protein KGF57_000993 [Candida theae]|uniref:RING-type E3 ubiquitin transferase n=1 Tax=Candida theae TaxID=1198502 RepID=A0AAD5BHY3_9ASCO|nr:uncharacterized protein KGF57_000993 [Candida theae]KAI5964501.1 hypothetical protein KGF57_000993 [Candida theae]
MSDATDKKNSNAAAVAVPVAAANSKTGSSRSRVSRGGKQGGNSTGPRSGYNKKNESDSSRIRHDENDIPESQQCLICAERIVYAALTPCNHTTCHKCTFRQRALYEKNNCLICRSENEKIVITEQLEKGYDDIEVTDIVAFDDKYHIGFTQEYVESDTLRLLENECQICHGIFPTFRELGDHAKDAHGKYYCLICSRHKKAFKVELPLYTYKQLQKHQSQGNDTGFKGHPECKHCQGKRFYSEDELHVHIRDRHERCHICDQTTPKTADYYRNYDALYQHFTKAHYVCTVPSCVEKRFVVFRDDLDLTAHMLKEHGGLNNGQRVVIGSNSYHHQHGGHFSQLSTFNNSRWLSSNEDQDEDQQSPQIKKRRFEERAKHYLNYDNSKYQEFTKINDLFSKKKINAAELLRVYQMDLFKHQTLEELNFLFKEFLEFFPKSSDLYKDLMSIIVEENETNPTEQFPVLGGSDAANAFTSNGWIGGRGSSRNSGASTPVDRFPPLKKPEKVNYVNPNQQPIRYSTIVKKNKPKTMNINRSLGISSPPPSLPNYLDRVSNTRSDPSLNSGSRSASSSSSQTFRPPTLHNGRASSPSAALDDNKFPALEKKQVKKVIPRVNEVKVTDPNSWGVNGSTSNGAANTTKSTNDNNGIEIVDKRKQKMKKKQDRILFSNAF